MCGDRDRDRDCDYILRKQYKDHDIVILSSLSIPWTWRKKHAMPPDICIALHRILEKQMGLKHFLVI